MNKDELLTKVKEVMEVTKDYNHFKNIFTEDAGKKALFNLHQALGDICFMINASNMKEIAHPKNSALQAEGFGHKQGALVAIRPVGEEYGKKTYLGFYLGDMALSSSITISEDKIQCNWARFNPAIYVPSLGKVIYGCESWWGEIKSEDDFQKITDETIADQWYVKAWKALAEKKENLDGKG